MSTAHTFSPTPNVQGSYLCYVNGIEVPIVGASVHELSKNIATHDAGARAGAGAVDSGPGRELITMLKARQLVEMRDGLAQSMMRLPKTSSKNSFTLNRAIPVKKSPFTSTHLVAPSLQAWPCMTPFDSSVHRSKLW